MKWSHDPWRRMVLEGQGRDPDIFRCKYLKTVRDRGLVPMDNQQEMAYGESIGHVIDDVTWPHKVKIVTSLCLGAK